MELSYESIKEILTEEFKYEVVDERLRYRVRQRAHELVSQLLLSDGQFRVVCDESNNPPESVEQGILNVDLKMPDWWVEWYLNELYGGSDGEAETPRTCP